MTLTKTRASPAVSSVDAFIEKRRASGKVSTGRLVGRRRRPGGIDRGRPLRNRWYLIRAAERCQEVGAIAVHVAVSHTPYAEGLEAVLPSGAITDVLVTDSVGIRPGHPLAVGRKLITLSIAALLGQAMRRMLAGKPVAPLLTRWPVRADS